MELFEQVLRFCWPAHAAAEADPDISPWQMTGAQKSELEKQEATIRAELTQIPKPEEFAKVVKVMTDSEAKRRETIETKAGAIVQAAGIVTALFSAVPAISGRAWSATGWEKAILLLLFGLTLIHLIMAIYMAIAARRIGAIYLPTADDAAELVQAHREDYQVEAAFLEIVRAKRNEGIIGMKANRLAAAETYYFRGLAFFGLTFLFGLGIS